MSRPARLDGFDYVGQYRYFLTFCTRHRAPIFLDGSFAELVLAHFRRTAVDHSFSYLAYCLMPDHAHALVEGLAADASLQRFVKSAKESSGRAYFRRKKRALWQEGYYERVLRKEDDARVVARYIIENPVRARLVEDASKYPFLGSDRWTVSQLLGSIQPPR
jgi:putative transposase